MIYFHGNAEDNALAFDQAQSIGDYLNVNVIMIEFPGFGLYSGNGSASEAKIKQDSEYVFRFILQDTGMDPGNIFVFGRSMGGGPAAFLAANFPCGALCLMSTYTSIRAVTGDKVGWLRFLVSERFSNLECVKKADMPTFILHGMADDVIPFHHG